MNYYLLIINFFFSPMMLAEEEFAEGWIDKTQSLALMN